MCRSSENQQEGMDFCSSHSFPFVQKRSLLFFYIEQSIRLMLDRRFGLFEKKMQCESEPNQLMLQFHLPNVPCVKTP